MHYDQLSQVQMYLKLNKPEDKLLYHNYILFSGDRTQADLICINDLLIMKKFALSLNGDQLISGSNENDLFHINTRKSNKEQSAKKLELGSSLDLANENDFYNIDYLKYYLNKKNVAKNGKDSSDPTKDAKRSKSVGLAKEEDINTKDQTKAEFYSKMKLKIQKASQPTQNMCTATSSKLSENVLINGFDNVQPILNIEDKRLHPAVRDYMRNCKGLRQISEFNSFCWPIIFRGRHLFGMSNEESSSLELSLSYLCPLLSLMLDNSENKKDNSKILESGYVKNSMNHSQNGPILLIVCTSCKSALRINEAIKEILNIVIIV